MGGTATRSRRLERLLESAAAALARRDLDVAERRYREAVSLDPGNAAALHQLAMVLLAGGRRDDAEACLARAVAAAPHDAAAQNNLGNLLLERGELSGAAAAYEAVLAREPAHLNARYNLATVLVRLARRSEAAAHYRALLERAPGDIDARKALATTLLDLGEVAEAERCLREAIARAPADVEALNLLGVLLARRGDNEQARRCYLAAIELRPDYARAYENLVRSERFESADGALVDRLVRLATSASSPREARVSALFALGKLYDDCGEYARAFACYREGNQLVRAGVDFDRGAHSAKVDAIIETLDEAFERAGGGIDTELPVYVLGMIRSGTSLVEQILASHPLVHGAGEQAIIPAAAAELAAARSGGFPRALAGLDATAVSAAARGCLAALQALGGGAARVVDKLPGNFLYLGLIARMFPRARIVHCVREPLDVCLSIYFQRFAEGHHYAYDLGDIASFYRDYRRLMAHWARVVPGTIHELGYETLVAEQERTSRALIAACGLEWDARCLAHHRTERTVSTASDWQVRQPVYTRSVQRWRHYDEHLGELRAALASSPSRGGGG